MLKTKSEMIEKDSEETINQDSSDEQKDNSTENPLSELNEPIWSIVNFEKILQANLTYDEALQKMQEAKEKNISGLCIITNEAAQRL